MTQNLPPLTLLKTLESLYPECWQQLALFRQPDFRMRSPWPDVCYVPIAAALAVVTKGMPVGEAKQASFRQRDIVSAGATLAGAAAWRIGKGVYRFDPDLLELVADADLRRGVPWATLERLPEWAVYVETPGWAIPRGGLHGFLAWIEYDANTRELELRFVLQLEDGTLESLILPRAETIEAGLARLQASGVRNAAAFGLVTVPTTNPLVAPLLERLVAAVLYLCAEESDLEPPLGKPPRAAIARGSSLAAGFGRFRAPASAPCALSHLPHG